MWVGATKLVFRKVGGVFHFADVVVVGSSSCFDSTLANGNCARFGIVSNRQTVVVGTGGLLLAAGAVELMENPELLARAKEEHANRVGPEGYIPPIPKDVKPMAMDAFRK